MLSFENIIKMTQKKLFNTLRREYCRDMAMFQNGSFILVKGEAPVMLVAHLDTVHSKPVSRICKSDDGIWMAPEGIGGDDRCGVFCLKTVREQASVKPWLLFTCDEEEGGIGAHGFVSRVLGKKSKIAGKLKTLKYLIEIDRKGENDAVYYSCGNKEFESYITSKGFKTDYGSYSDISTIAPELGVAAVNLSSGYYNAHNRHEYINIHHLGKTIERVIGLVNESVSDEVPAYEYIEAYYRNPYYGGWYSGWSRKTETYSHESVAPNLSERGIQMYNELLDTYYPSELDELIAVDGEKGLEELYEEEYLSYKYECPEYDSNETENAPKYHVPPVSELSSELYQMYQELLQIYTSEDLYKYRSKYGDSIIKTLYNSTYGYSNAANYGR